MLKHLATRKVTAKNQTQLTPKIMLGPPKFAAHSESWEDNPGRETSNNSGQTISCRRGRVAASHPLMAMSPDQAWQKGAVPHVWLEGLSFKIRHMAFLCHPHNRRLTKGRMTSSHVRT